MKILQSLLILVVATIASANFVIAQNTDDVIQKYINAIGGKERMQTIKALRFNAVTNEGGMEIPIVMTMSKPGSIAIEVTFQGMSMKQAFDGTTGWMINPFSGKTEPELMNPEMCKAMKSQADIDGSLINYAAKGFTAEFLGEDEFEGTAVYKIKINRADGDYDMFYIDAESYLILMQKTKTTFEGKEMISETVLSDYRTIDGYTTAFVIEQRAEGSTQGSKIEIKEVKINPEVAADYFAFPENK